MLLSISTCLHIVLSHSDSMEAEYMTIYVISAYHHYSCDFESRSGEVYSIQHYVIKFVSDLRQFSVFPLILPVSAVIYMKYLQQNPV
jgi:hypothetical protein